MTRVDSQVILTSMAEPAEMVAQTVSEDPEVGLRGVASLRALLCWGLQVPRWPGLLMQDLHA